MVLSIREASLPYSHHGKFGLWTGFIFTINCTIGAGFLSIPWAFNNAGWLFCITIQILAGIQGYFLAQQVLELMSRSEVLVRMTEEGKDIHPISWKKLFSKPKTSKSLISPPHLVPIITNRVINLPDMVKLVFGPKAGFAFLFVLFISQVGTCVAYVSIFSSSFASNVPIGNEETCDIYSTNSFYNDCRWKYWFYLFIFAVFTIYMTIKGMQEQQLVQFCMSVLRFLVMISIIVTCLVDIAFHKNNENDEYNSICSRKGRRSDSDRDICIKLSGSTPCDSRNY